MEKYRPKTLEEVILPETDKAKIKEYLNQGRIPHLAFQGPPGTGKSTIARIIRNAICKSPDDYIALNASLHGRIETVRNVILPFLKTPPMASKQKIVYFEEFDNTSPDAQLALREPIESGSKNVAFLLTFNYVNRVDQAILSRMQVFTVSAPPFEKCVERCEYILQQEGIKYNIDDIVSLVSKLYPHLRDIIKALQRFSVNGEFRYDSSAVINDFDEILQHTKEILSMRVSTDYANVRRALKSLVMSVSKSYVDLPSILNELTKDDSLPIEIRLEAGGLVDSVAKSIAPTAAFMNAIWRLVTLKGQLERQGLV